MTALYVAAALAVALLAQTTLVPVLPGGSPPADLVLVVVVLAALHRGPVAGLWVGTAGGLLQDALSGGIVGVGGLTKTLVGVSVGVIGTQFIVGSVWQRMVIVLVVSVIHAFCFVGVYVLIAVGGPTATLATVAVQAVINVVGAGVAEGILRGTPGVTDRMRRGRNTISRRRWIMT